MFVAGSMIQRVPSVLHHFSHYMRQHVKTIIHDWKQPARFDWQSTVAILAGAVLLFPLVVQLPVLGYDWYFFDREAIANYPPWVYLVLKPLTIWEWRDGLALLNGLMLATLAVATAREARQQSRAARFVAIAMSIFAAPPLMLMWQGNPAGLVLFGLISLPYGLIYAGLQPHLVFFAVLTRRIWLFWAVGLVSLSFVFFGFWPPALLEDSVTGRLAHPIAMGVAELGIPILLIGLLLLPFTKADPLQSMALGSFFVPYLMSVHFVLLLPALGRVRGYRRWALWLGAWLPLLPVMFTSLESKYAAMVFPLMVWWFLHTQNRDQTARVQQISSP